MKSEPFGPSYISKYFMAFILLLMFFLRTNLTQVPVTYLTNMSCLLSENYFLNIFVFHLFQETQNFYVRVLYLKL